MPQAAPRADSRDAFERARRHSGRVRLFKNVLPIIALIGIVLVGAVLFISRIVPEGSVDLASTSISDGKLVMASPKLNGVTKDNRPYRVTAAQAVQDLSGKTALELEKLVANVALENGAQALLEAPTGRYDDAKNTLKLDQQSVLTMSDGLRAVFGAADIDLSSGTVAARQKVTITREQTTIYADNMDIYDGGKRIVFSDNVTLVLQPSVVSKSSQSSADDAVSNPIAAN